MNVSLIALAGRLGAGGDGEINNVFSLKPSLPPSSKIQGI